MSRIAQGFEQDNCIVHSSPLRDYISCLQVLFHQKFKTRGYIQCTTEGIRKSYTIWCKQKLKLSLWDEICPTFYDPISCHNLFTEMSNSVAKMCSQDAQLKQKPFQKPTTHWMDLDLRKHAFLVGRLQFVLLFLLKKQVRREKDHLKNANILGKRNHPLTLLLICQCPPHSFSFPSLPHQMTAWPEGIY